MDQAQSAAELPSLDVEVEEALQELRDVRNAALVGSIYPALQGCLNKVVSLASQHEPACAMILKDEEAMDLVLRMLKPEWYPASQKGDEPWASWTCMALVCQIIYELSGLVEFRQSLPVRVHTDILTCLVGLLSIPAPRHQRSGPNHVSSSLAVTAHAALLSDVCDAIANASREHKDAKRLICDIGAIPPLVRLLDSVDGRLQRGATSVLRTLAFKEESAKQEIVDSGALPPLIRMLRSEDHQTHYEAVGTLGNLVHSSPDIKRAVLQEGVLQPVINLLSCTCRDSLREGALLIGQFAQLDARRGGNAAARNREDEYRVRIVQRGAVPPLIEMLRMPDRALREMAAFALGRLAQNSDNQAGIFAMGVLPPLLDLLTSKVRNLEHNAAFTLYGLSDNPDNVPEIIKQGGYEKLRQVDFPDEQPTKDCIVKTLKRIAERVQGSEFIKEHLMSLLRSKSMLMRQRMATALAHLLDADDCARAYAEHDGASVLLDVVCDAASADVSHLGWCAAMAALREVVLVAKKREKDASSSFVPSAPEKKVIIDKSYVNNPRVHDVVFVVEGEPFYAHKLALSASSEAFGAMFESPCREGDGGGGVPSIAIPHIPRPVFHAMMLFIYTGDPSAADAVPDAPAPQLLQAADQYLLDKLKVKCAEDLARTLTVDNVRDQFELATRFNATKLAHAAVAFCVTEHAAMESVVEGGRKGVIELLHQIRPTLEAFLADNLASRLLSEGGAGASGDLPLSARADGGGEFVVID